MSRNRHRNRRRSYTPTAFVVGATGAIEAAGVRWPKLLEYQLPDDANEILPDAAWDTNPISSHAWRRRADRRASRIRRSYRPVRDAAEAQDDAEEWMRIWRELRTAATAASYSTCKVIPLWPPCGCFLGRMQVRAKGPWAIHSVDKFIIDGLFDYHLKAEHADAYEGVAGWPH